MPTQMTKMAAELRLDRFSFSTTLTFLTLFATFSYADARFCRNEKCDDSIGVARVKSDHPIRTHEIELKPGALLNIISKSDDGRILQWENHGHNGIVAFEDVEDLQLIVPNEDLQYVADGFVVPSGMEDTHDTNKAEQQTETEQVLDSESSKAPHDDDQRNNVELRSEGRIINVSQSLETQLPAGDHSESVMLLKSSATSDTDLEAELLNVVGSLEDDPHHHSDSYEREPKLAEVKDAASSTLNTAEKSSQELVSEKGIGEELFPLQAVSDPTPKFNRILQLPKFDALRRERIKDYVNTHFSGDDLTAEMKRGIDDLISSDLINELKNTHSGLYEFMASENKVDNSQGAQTQMEDRKDQDSATKERDDLPQDEDAAQDRLSEQILDVGLGAKEQAEFQLDQTDANKIYPSEPLDMTSVSNIDNKTVTSQPHFYHETEVLLTAPRFISGLASAGRSDERSNFEWPSTTGSMSDISSYLHASETSTAYILFETPLASAASSVHDGAQPEKLGFSSEQSRVNDNVVSEIKPTSLSDRFKAKQSHFHSMMRKAFHMSMDHGHASHRHSDDLLSDLGHIAATLKTLGSDRSHLVSSVPFAGQLEMSFTDESFQVSVSQSPVADSHLTVRVDPSSAVDFVVSSEKPLTEVTAEVSQMHQHSDADEHKYHSGKHVDANASETNEGNTIGAKTHGQIETSYNNSDDHSGDAAVKENAGGSFLGIGSYLSGWFSSGETAEISNHTDKQNELGSPGPKENDNVIAEGVKKNHDDVLEHSASSTETVMETDKEMLTSAVLDKELGKETLLFHSSQHLIIMQSEQSIGSAQSDVSTIAVQTGYHASASTSDSLVITSVILPEDREGTVFENVDIIHEQQKYFKSGNEEAFREELSSVMKEENLGKQVSSDTRLEKGIESSAGTTNGHHNHMQHPDPSGAHNESADNTSTTRRGHVISQIKDITRWVNGYLAEEFSIFGRMMKSLSLTLSGPLFWVLCATGKEKDASDLSEWMSSVSSGFYGFLYLVFAYNACLLVVIYLWIARTPERQRYYDQNDAVHEQVHIVRHELDAKSEECDALKREVQELISDKSRLAESVECAIADGASWKEKFLLEQSSNEEAGHKISALEDEVRSSNSALWEQDRQNQQLLSEKYALAAENVELLKDKEESESKIFYIVKDLDSKEAKIDVLEEDLAKKDKIVDQQRTELSKKVQLLEEKTKQIAELTDVIKKLEMDLKNAKEDISVKETELEVMRALLMKKKDVDAIAEADGETDSRDENYADALEKILETSKTIVQLQSTQQRLNEVLSLVEVLKAEMEKVARDNAELRGRNEALISDASKYKTQAEEFKIQKDTLSQYFQDREGLLQRTVAEQLARILDSEKELALAGGAVKRNAELEKRALEMDFEHQKEIQEWRTKCEALELEKHNAVIKERQAVRDKDVAVREKELYRKRLSEMQKQPPNPVSPVYSSSPEKPSSEKGGIKNGTVKTEGGGPIRSPTGSSKSDDGAHAIRDSPIAAGPVRHYGPPPYISARPPFGPHVPMPAYPGPPFMSMSPYAPRSGIGPITMNGPGGPAGGPYATTNSASPPVQQSVSSVTPRKPNEYGAATSNLSQPLGRTPLSTENVVPGTSNQSGVASQMMSLPPGMVPPRFAGGLGYAPGMSPMPIRPPFGPAMYGPPPPGMYGHPLQGPPSFTGRSMRPEAGPLQSKDFVQPGGSSGQQPPNTSGAKESDAFS